MESSTSLAVIVILLIANGFFVAAEFALVKVRMTRIESMAKEGGLSNKLMLMIKRNLESYLAACQLGITMASLGLGWVGEPAVAKLLQPLFASFGLSDEMLHISAFLVGFIIFSSLHIVIGEQVPKTYAIRKPEKVSIWVALPLHGFYLMTYPLTRALNWSASSILKLMGVKEASHEEIFSVEEISELIEASSESGEMDLSKADMIQNMFAFDSRIARDVMMSRSKVDCIDVCTPWQETVERIRMLGHSRYPLVDGSLDKALGFLLLKDVTNKILNNESLDESALREMARPAVIMPEVMSLQKAFDELRKSRNHMAFVIDEHGAFVGILTMEDLIEEIVGEISDELDDEEPNIQETQAAIDIYAGFEVDGLMALHDFEKRVNEKFEGSLDVSTLSGLIMMQLNGLPEVGATVTYQGWVFKVESLAQYRPEKVFVKRLPTKPENNSENLEI
ncbi:hemolysin family protein [Thiosulfativibrio zosterae]|uniref:Membrane protein n=1 Tax=Thiosulfativibrio zosterae TaxID=2675053 RepID=A0A6F8PPD2_9GAMM|nr:hemolysin family protein [Thiosulfativibrio zosterae]BBP43973.1 membrane protein [Thiosulfativibrio zosterae]